MCSIVKFADDTTASWLIVNSETDYWKQLSALLDWCFENYLELNVRETKEMISNFRLKLS